jgi:hypothetical protein
MIVDTARINAIYEELSTINFEIAADPRTLGAGYIARSIKHILDQIERANALAVEVRRAYTAIQEELSLLKLEWEVSVRDTLLSRRVQDLEGVSLEEKRARSQQLVNERYQQRKAEEFRARNEPVPDLPTLEMKIVITENRTTDLRTLQDAIKEKVTSLRRADSAVRLQNTSLETEAKLFGSIPSGHNGNGQNGHTTSRRRRGRRPQEVQTDEGWSELRGGSDQTQQPEEAPE